MDMNYLVQRRINAKKKYRRKVILTITLGVLLLVLIIVGLVKILIDEKQTGNDSNQNIKNSVSVNRETNHPDTEVVPEIPDITATPTVTPTPTPIPPKKVAVDAGHGGDDLGCTRDGLYEKDANLAIAFYLQQMLESAGYDVIMIRDEDVLVDKEDRPVYAKNADADIFVSIHLNSLEGDSDATRGFEVWYDDRRDDGSDALAQCIVDEMGKVLDARNRGVKETEGLVVLKYSEMPAVLVECGFITSETERAMLFDPVYQEKLAEGIFNGILKFLPTE